MTDVKIDESDADSTDLFHWYQGQSAPQPVYVQLDTRDGELIVDYDPNVGGNTTTFAVRDGIVLQFPLPNIPTTAGANALLARIAPLAQAVLDADEAVEAQPQRSYEDGPSEADDALSDALSDLRAALEDPFTDDEIIAVWSIDSVGDLDDIFAQITAETTDAQLDEIEADLLSQLAEGYGAAVCDGLQFVLDEERDSKRAAATVESAS